MNSYQIPAQAGLVLRRTGANAALEQETGRGQHMRRVGHEARVPLQGRGPPLTPRPWLNGHDEEDKVQGSHPNLSNLGCSDDFTSLQTFLLTSTALFLEPDFLDSSPSSTTHLSIAWASFCVLIWKWQLGVEASGSAELSEWDLTLVLCVGDLDFYGGGEGWGQFLWTALKKWRS